MFDNVDEQFRMYEQAEAASIIEETIEMCSMPFTHEELMETIDHIKQRLEHKYKKAQRKRHDRETRS